MEPCCACCAFQGRPVGKATAAFVLMFQTQDTETSWTTWLSEIKESMMIPAQSAYCSHCRCIRPLTDQSNAVDAMVAFQVQDVHWRAWLCHE